MRLPSTPPPPSPRSLPHLLLFYSPPPPSPSTNALIPPFPLSMFYPSSPPSSYLSPPSPSQTLLLSHIPPSQTLLFLLPLPFQTPPTPCVHSLISSLTNIYSDMLRLSPSQCLAGIFSCVPAPSAHPPRDFRRLQVIDYDIRRKPCNKWVIHYHRQGKRTPIKAIKGHRSRGRRKEYERAYHGAPASCIIRKH